MYAYYVYWIKSEFAHHYFYKSDILYRFLKNYQTNQTKIDLSTQFQHITNNFLESDLFSHFKNDYLNRIHFENGSDEINICTEQQDITLHIHEKHLIFYCDTIYDAENLLFPILRKFHPLLFIMGRQTNNYGWISPVTNEQIFKRRLELYS